MYDRAAISVPLGLITQHLKTIHLERLILDHSTLNFSGCPVLEDLEIRLSRIDARKISSESLKRLCITDFCYLPEDFRVRICAPGLISLQLDNFEGLTPFLESIPLLETAYVRIDYLCNDCCHSNQGVWNISCWCGHAYPEDRGMLLTGLSNAVNLELIAEPGMHTYRWDLKWRPVFGKLKTLLLNEWFTAIDLVCILQHSPILETLNIQLGNTKNLVGATGAEEKIEQSFVCPNLKVVNIKCKKVDEGISKILKILNTFGIPREHISIKDPSSWKDLFSFEKHR